MKRITAATLASFALAGAAHAHAYLDHAAPKVGSTVKTAPAELQLWFDDPINSAVSTAEVLDVKGCRVDPGKVHVDKKDATLLHVPLPKKLPPGTYKVHWQVLDTVCPHHTEGTYTFKIK